jgi:TP901 family phage tail tape measure protein
MAIDLKIQVLLNAIDKASKPLRQITGGSAETAKALRAAREQTAQLNQQQRDISAYRIANLQIVKQSRALADLNRKTSDTTALLSKQQTAHINLKGNLKAAQTQYNKLSKALVNGKGRTAEFMRELEKSQIKLQSAQQAFTRSSSSIRTYQDRLRAAKTQLGQLNTQHTASQIKLTQYKTKLDQAGIGTDGLSAKVRNLRNQQNLLNASMDKQKAKLQQLNRASQSYQRGKQTAQMLATKGAAATAGGGAALYAGSRLLAPGIEYGAQMSELQAVTRLGKEDERFTALKQQARDLGGSTAFSATQVGAGQTFLARAGFTPEAINASMQDILDLALANGVDLARTADIASNISSAFKIDPEVGGNITRVTDVLSAASARANINLVMMGETMKYMGSAESLGLTLEQAATMAGLLGNIGVQGSQAGTTMRAMLNRLAAPAKEAQNSIAELGLQVSDSNGNLRDMPSILQDVANATDKMGNTQRTAHLRNIFGTEAGSGMAELIDKQGTGALKALLSELQNAQGENAKMARTRADNIDGDLKGLRSAWEEVGIGITDVNEGPLREFIRSITDVVRGVGKWIKENPALAGGLIKAAAIIAGLTLAIGGLLVTVASVMLPFVALRFMFARMGVQLPSLIGLLWKLGKVVLPFVGKALLMIGRALMLNPIGLAITAIATAAYLIYSNWDAVKTYFTSAWAEIQAGFSGGVGGILTVLANFSPLGLIYQAFAGVLGYLGIDLPNRFTEFGNMIVNGLVNGLFAGLGQIKGAITSIGDSTIGWFKEKLGIHSPSRVFAELGGFTMDGLTQGLRSGEAGPLNAMSRISKQITAASAIALSGIALPTMAIGATGASALSIDNRAPVTRPAASTYDSHDQYEINIHPTPGMDAQAIARAVRLELTRIESEKSARSRSSLKDRE